MTWKPETFDTATVGGIVAQPGYVYRGLGLFIVMEASPKGRRPPTWSLTHLGSGHRVALIDGKVADAFPVASEIAEAGDWEFDSLTGWKDRFPDATDRVREVMARHPKRIRMGGAKPLQDGEKQAQEIAQRRWA